MKQLIIIFIFFNFYNCQANGDEGEAEVAPIISIKNTESPDQLEHNDKKIQNICDICACNDSTIDCSSHQLDNNLSDTPWNNKTNKLVTFDSNSIVYLKKFPNVTIEKLIISRNRITKIDDQAFKWIKNLTELDLSYNHLTSKILRPEIFQGKFSPEEWEPLAKLRVLNLGNNNLHTLNQDLFEHINDLTTLIISGNPFTVLDHGVLSAFSDLRDIEELNIAYCDLGELPEHFFHSTQSSLKRLYLNGNRFTSVPDALEDAKSLEYLNLDENLFKDINKQNNFPSLNKLKILSLRSLPHLTKISDSAFSELTALEELYLEDCPRLKEIHEDAFVKHSIHGAIWPQLKILDISNNALKYLPSDLIARWDKLEYLSIINNDWVCDCDNQDLIGNLLPNLGKKLMGNQVDDLYCAAPPEHAGKNLTSLAKRKLRCLDYYGSRPERDAAILIGVVLGLFLAIPIVLTLLFFWKRGFCIIFNSNNPASFSRAYYKRATNNDDF
ncbi:hypothetical protein HCN44_003705 [Aphidius gifuensis]|uniref:LRRCT domain-containing protein n=2 Tax=Aphidius gifuensis TaxID=684658 RepID=A0A835CL30_APHGI|nr:hypothetical protein HCN44_003705 [Aphidius gifuensis]